jgi:D-alanine-D-alanine ligase
MWPIVYKSLPDTEKFLSFDRLWEIYDDESPMPQNENFYEYQPVKPSLIPALKKISMDAYKAVGGRGYTRIDIRMDAKTGKLYMLEVNAQCGLSEDENYTSIGAILKVSGRTFTEIMVEILKDAIRRNVSETIMLKRKKTTTKKLTANK